MTVKEAKEICARLECYDETLSDEDFFLYTEALGFLIEKNRKPNGGIQRTACRYDAQQ